AVRDRLPDRAETAPPGAVIGNVFDDPSRHRDRVAEPPAAHHGVVCEKPRGVHTPRLRLRVAARNALYALVTFLHRSVTPIRVWPEPKAFPQKRCGCVVTVGNYAPTQRQLGSALV